MLRFVLLSILSCLHLETLTLAAGGDDTGGIKVSLSRRTFKNFAEKPYSDVKKSNSVRLGLNHLAVVHPSSERKYLVGTPGLHGCMIARTSLDRGTVYALNIMPSVDLKKALSRFYGAAIGGRDSYSNPPLFVFSTGNPTHLAVVAALIKDGFSHIFNGVDPSYGHLSVPSVLVIPVGQTGRFTASKQKLKNTEMLLGLLKPHVLYNPKSEETAPLIYKKVDKPSPPPSPKAKPLSYVNVAKETIVNRKGDKRKDIPEETATEALKATLSSLGEQPLQLVSTITDPWAAKPLPPHPPGIGGNIWLPPLEIPSSNKSTYFSLFSTSHPLESHLGLPKDDKLNRPTADLLAFSGSKAYSS